MQHNTLRKYKYREKCENLKESWCNSRLDVGTSSVARRASFDLSIIDHMLSPVGTSIYRTSVHHSLLL